jgi:hypothetical protein
MNVYLKSIFSALLILSVSFNVLATDVWTGISKIVAIGDIHGDYKNYRQVLSEAGLINRRGNWIAGDTHFVQLGDLADRGPDTDKVIKHMMKLQRQAQASGGAVHALIGNHEAMNMLGDLRYVHPGEYAALRSSNSRRLRSDYYDREVARLQDLDEGFAADRAFRDQWQEAHPLGFVEHRIAWHFSGDFGSWVVKNNAIVKINRSLFLHGGVSPSLITKSIPEINRQIQNELGGILGLEEEGLSESVSGPLWYRGLASGSEEVEAAHVDAVLAAYDVDRIIVGHTPGYGIILPRFGGKVLVIDTGIAAHYGGHIASLRIENNLFISQQANKELLLPSSQEEVLPYLERAEALVSPTPALQRLLAKLR